MEPASRLCRALLTGCRYEQIWKIAMFLKGMDKLRDELPPAVDAEWKKVPSVAAAPPPK